MEATRIGADELTRLQAVQARVRALARNHGWFADATRDAYAGFMALGERFQREKSAMLARESGLVREQLAKGRLSDPKTQDNGPCLFVRVRGLCPVSLANRLGKYRSGDAMPKTLERESAAAALAALDREAKYEDRDLPDTKREAMAAEFRAAEAAKTHVSFSWMIVVSRPAGWQEPADPHSLDAANLRRFAEADYRTIALHRLGGLADVGALRPIIPQPTDTGDTVRDLIAFAQWQFRLPIEHDHRDQTPPPLSVRVLPPDVAEQLLDEVETWAKVEASTRGESLTARGASVSPDLVDGLETAAAAIPVALEQNREAIERVACVIESLSARDDDDTPAVKFPELKAHDRQAWQLATLYGMTQHKVAAALNKEHGTVFTQGQVSRMIARAKAHADSNGLSEKVRGRIDRPRTIDPGRLELGARVDKGKPRPSDMARANDDDE